MSVMKRDLQALCLAYQIRFMTIDDAKVCVYGNRNVAQRRLVAVEKAGFLLSFHLTPGKKGPPTKVYYLNAKKRQELSAMIGEELDKNAIPTSPPRNMLPAVHMLDLNKVLVSFIAGAASRGFRFGFIPEYAPGCHGGGRGGLLCDKVKDPQNPRRMVDYRRDAVCCLGTDKGKALFEIEYDTGKEVLQSAGPRKVTIAKKILVFVQSVKERRFERYSSALYFDHPFKVTRLLIITNSDARARNIAALCLDLKVPGLVYVTSAEKVDPASVFGPIWLVADNDCITEKGLVRSA